MERQNRYHVIVSERATQMLVSHAAFLAQVSPEVAERLTAEFEKTADSLEIVTYCKVAFFLSYRKLRLLYDKKSSGQERTAAEKKYVARATRRRRRILQSEILSCVPKEVFMIGSK